MSNRAKVQSLLEANFSKTNIRHTENGFKINCSGIQNEKISALATIESICWLEIRRSGSGIVLIAEPLKD